jgi:hypothetical protein
VTRRDEIPDSIDMKIAYRKRHVLRLLSKPVDKRSVEGDSRVVHSILLGQARVLFEKLALLENKADTLEAYQAIDEIIVWSAALEDEYAKFKVFARMAAARAPASKKVRARREKMRPFIEQAARSLVNMSPEELARKVTKSLMGDRSFRAMFSDKRRVITSDVKAILLPEPEEF